MILRGRDPGSGTGMSVLVEGDHITAIEPAAARDGDPWLAPGLVDLQLNGFAGIDLNDGHCTAARVVELCHAVAQTGTTTFLATLITAPQERLLATARAIAEACATDALAAHLVVGIHLEGPAISPAEGYRGAHPEAAVRPPSLDELLQIQHASGGRVRLVTLSPHWAEAPAFIAALSAQGILCSIGHTHATAAEIAGAVDAGARLSTHLGNALPLTLPRHSNPIWPQLAEDRLLMSIIADGTHLPPEMLRAMLRAKGTGHSILVSDAVAFAGMPPGCYPAAIGGGVLVGADGSVRMGDTGLLAGSGISLATAVARCASLARIPLAEALAMATHTPARLLGSQPGQQSGHRPGQQPGTAGSPVLGELRARGEMRPGASADLLAFHYHPGDAALSLAQVVVQGRSLPLNSREVL